MAAILGTFVASCIKKLQQIIVDEAVLVLGVEKNLSELQRRMRQIQCFLHDAEQRRIEESAVDNWLGDLKDAMYDADDIIDLAKFEGSKLLTDHSSSLSAPSRKTTVCSGISVFSCFQNMKVRHRIAVQIRILNNRLEKISMDKTFLTLENVVSVGKSSAMHHRKSSHLVEPIIVGNEIKNATAQLVELVHVNKDRQSYKIAIVGTAGIGKTTLAQKIYNDQRMMSNFSKRAWICVSQEYSEVNLLKELLRSTGVHKSQGETVGELQSEIASVLEDESFFLVLDDIWHCEVWTYLLRTPLHAAARGVILVTTRDDMLAKQIGTELMHRVQLMPVDVGWELLWKSMNINEEKDVENLQAVGFEIVKKCGSLPLAIKVIASVLATKEKTENQWRKVMTDNAWSMSKLPAELRGALYLSYDELPQYLKQCFVYCALFPEDYVMHRDDLVRLWVAEGFVEEQECQILEDTAEEYYYELIYRNLLDPHPLFLDYSRCRMHDLLRHLGLHLSRKECFMGHPQTLESHAISKLRHIAVVTKEKMAVLPNLNKDKLKVRTLMLFHGKLAQVDSAIFVKLPQLRVLDLTGSPIQSIPADIEGLIHLRLLNLDRTSISYIPESIGSLINLQIFNLQECSSLHSLPMGVTRLCNLRCLGLSRTPITQVPKGIGHLAFLNDLKGFPVGHDCVNDKMQDGWVLRELDCLSQLKNLDIIKLERAIPSGIDSLLVHKQHLKILTLRCTERRYEPLQEEANRIEDVFEELVPPCGLEDLSIMGFFGRRYSSWLESQLSSVKFLKLVYCICWEQVPPLGQLPSMTFLKIQGAFSVNRIGPEFLGGGMITAGSPKLVAFPKLEVLVIENMPKWEEWSLTEKDKQAKGDNHIAPVMQKSPSEPEMLLFMPCLQTLQLMECPKLRALPRQLAHATHLKELFIRGASSLKVVEDLPYISRDLIIHTCEGLERISNLPQLRCLKVSACPGLRFVGKFDNLQQLGLSKDMQDWSSRWLSDLQQQHQRLHGKYLGIYSWDPSTVKLE